MVVTRSQLTEDELLIQELNASDDLSEFADLTKIAQMFRYSISQQSKIIDQVDKNSEDIATLKQENSKLKVRLDNLNEDRIRIEQYSRKDVLLVTGLKMEDRESQSQLFQKITGIFNDITENYDRTFTKDDFIAVHRNGISYKGNRPPTVTVKFLRFYDKDVMFNKDTRTKLRVMFDGVKFHHNMCRPLIEEQNRINEHASVKFSIYQGDRSNFSVYLHEGQFMNKIKNYADLIKKLAK